MNYPELVIDKEKCVHCELCIKDCICGCLELNEKENIPQFKKYKEGACIKCQHCFAICPTGALSIWGKHPENNDSKNNINPDELYNLIKSRRSIRKYKPTNLDKERLAKLKDMLKYTPTGVNNHKLHFAFVDDIEVMDDIRNKANPKVVELLENPVIKKMFPHFAGLKDAIESGNDVIFRGAPHMVIVSTPTDAPCSKEDPIIALSYFELFAQSMGIGTLWCGFAYYCFKMFPSLCDYIGVPKGYKVGYVMLFGEPDVKYSRTTQPNELEISSVPLGGNRLSEWSSNVKQLFNNWIR